MNRSKMLSDFIEELIEILEEHGDMPVATSGNADSVMSTKVFTEVNGHYYDGGCLYPTQNRDCHCSDWKSSKYNQAEFGDKYLVITSDSPDLTEGGDTVNGHILPELEDCENDEELERQLENIEKEFMVALGKNE